MVELARPLLCKWAKYKDKVVIETGKFESGTVRYDLQNPQKISHILLYIMLVLGASDDFLLVAPSEHLCRQYLNTFLHICSEIGIPVGPSQALTFFGVELDPGSTSFILLNNTVNELVDASLAPRTNIMYNRIWEIFCGFCKSYLTVPDSNLPVSITTLSLYLAHFREPSCGGMYFKKAFDFHQPRALIWASKFSQNCLHLPENYATCNMKMEVHLDW
jgi:hypothetical protein